MTHVGIRIAKPTFDVLVTLTEATKKNFILLDDTQEVHKLVAKISQAGTTYTHNLGYKPIVEAFAYFSSTPRYEATQVKVTTTDLTIVYLGGFFTPDSYEIFLFNEGI